APRAGFVSFSTPASPSVGVSRSPPRRRRPRSLVRYSRLGLAPLRRGLFSCDGGATDPGPALGGLARANRRHHDRRRRSMGHAAAHRARMVGGAVMLATELAVCPGNAMRPGHAIYISPEENLRVNVWAVSNA